MNDTNKLELLNQYTLSDNSIEWVTDQAVISQADIPMYWKKAFVTADLTERKSLIIAEWEKYFAKELSNMILYLKSYLKNVELIKIGSEYSILYTFLSHQSQKEMYYEGKNPLTIQDLSEVLHYPAGTIDQSLVNFYTKLHNGFYDFTSKSMGLDSLDNVDSMSEFDWEYEAELSLDLTHLYNFFSSGTGSYLVLDLEKELSNGAYLWSTKEAPKGNLNFWDVVDEWLIIGLDY